MLHLMKDHAHHFLPAPAVPITDLLSLRFLTKYTSVSSVEELIALSGVDVRVGRLSRMGGRGWDAYIRSVSVFPHWRALLAEAKREWYFKQRIFQKLAA